MCSCARMASRRHAADQRQRELRQALQRQAELLDARFGEGAQCQTSADAARGAAHQLDHALAGEGPQVLLGGIGRVKPSSAAISARVGGAPVRSMALCTRSRICCWRSVSLGLLLHGLSWMGMNRGWIPIQHLYFHPVCAKCKTPRWPCSPPAAPSPAPRPAPPTTSAATAPRSWACRPWSMRCRRWPACRSSPNRWRSSTARTWISRLGHAGRARGASAGAAGHHRRGRSRTAPIRWKKPPMCLPALAGAGLPVVLAAAMRLATALLRDGPQNLLDAVTLAREPERAA